MRKSRARPSSGGGRGEPAGRQKRVRGLGVPNAEARRGHGRSATSWNWATSAGGGERFAGRGGEPGLGAAELLDRRDAQGMPERRLARAAVQECLQRRREDDQRLRQMDVRRIGGGRDPLSPVSPMAAGRRSSIPASATTAPSATTGNTTAAFRTVRRNSADRASARDQRARQQRRVGRILADAADGVGPPVAA